jgi:L-ascorbate metabolism protein UlaG (beta-lactamase superfamily)
MQMRQKCSIGLLLIGIWMLGVSTANAQTVKVTPLGQRTGDFCMGDRAMLFEDPTGVRILYDPGNTITGATDPRLGDVHAILLSHAHPDHLGASRLNQDPNSPAAVCTAAPGIASTNSVVAEIAAAKNSIAVAGPPLATWLGTKIAAQLGAPNTAGCPAAGLNSETVVPRTSPCTGGLSMGGKRTIRMNTATQGVQIASVRADHADEMSTGFVSDPERTNLSGNALVGHVGVANGFVVTFTNGLIVYLSGDTGFVSEMSTVVNNYYRANLAVLNVGDIFTIGPDEGAFAVFNMIKPVTVIPSHVNEAATNGGVLDPTSKTARFVNLISSSGVPFPGLSSGRKVNVYLPLAGVTMEFDGTAQCRTGCR